MCLAFVESKTETLFGRVGVFGIGLFSSEIFYMRQLVVCKSNCRQKKKIRAVTVKQIYAQNQNYPAADRERVILLLLITIFIKWKCFECNDDMAINETVPSTNSADAVRPFGPVARNTLSPLVPAPRYA